MGEAKWVVVAVRFRMLAMPGLRVVGRVGVAASVGASCAGVTGDLTAPICGGCGSWEGALVRDLAIFNI